MVDTTCNLQATLGGRQFALPGLLTHESVVQLTAAQLDVYLTGPIMAVAHQTVPDEDPLAISVAALSEDSTPMPDASFACVGDAIDVSVQDGFLRQAPTP